MNEVAASFYDRERNFRRWLALEKCVFRNPMTDEYVAVSIGKVQKLSTIFAVRQN